MASQGDSTASPGDDAYLFPRHPTEMDRLDVQHYALKVAFGRNHLAPIARPARILDSGSGSGQWAYELCAEFPEALVVGFDLVRSKPGQPANYRLVRGNLLQGLPVAGDAFDFVHQRLLVPGVPLKRWADVMGELVRVTRRDGWVELVEGDWAIESGGPASERLVEVFGRLGRSHGLDTTGIVFRSLETCLERAGLVDVERRPVDIALGDWGGRVGSLMATDYRSAAMRMSAAVPQLGISQEEWHELVRTAQREWDDNRCTCSFAIAYGRKP